MSLLCALCGLCQVSWFCSAVSDARTDIEMIKVHSDSFSFLITKASYMVLHR